jgi:hypothetical protein
MGQTTEGLVDLGAGAVLHLAGWVAFGVDVAELPELERAFIRARSRLAPDSNCRGPTPFLLPVSRKRSDTYRAQLGCSATRTQLVLLPFP